MRSARAQATRFWHRLSAPALAHHLINAARRSGIQQAVLHSIQSGYLKGERLTHHHPEVTSMRHPQCVELIDSGWGKFIGSHNGRRRRVAG